VTMPERGNNRPALTAMCERVLLRVLRRDSLAAMLAQFIARCTRHVIAQGENLVLVGTQQLESASLPVDGTQAFAPSATVAK
jgi:hypothetical protein